MKKRPVTLTVAVALAGLAVLQFVPVDRSNPATTREIAWDSELTRDLARRACYDCHSSETVWPWYGHVAPVSWLVAKDVREGREHLNFSAWDEPNEDPEHIVESVQSGEMPLRKYLLLHPEARLDEDSKAAFIEGLRKTLASDPPVLRDEG